MRHLVLDEINDEVGGIIIVFHSSVTEPNSLVHVIQVGSKDVSNFIDTKLTIFGGNKTSLHDVTGYKGEVYGVQLPQKLEADYARQIGQIFETNQSGRSIADVPAI